MRGKKVPSEENRRSTPAQQDQSEILEEVGATRDDDGELRVDEDQIKEIGAVDVDAVRENRRMKEYTNKRKGGVKGASFNTDDVLQRYDLILAEWPANTIDISIRRLTGSPVQTTILSRPRSGTELYEAIRVVHGATPEADYELKFVDNSTRVWRGSGRITMPDTRPQQGQPPMTHPYYPGGPPMPPGYGMPPQQAPAAPPAAPAQTAPPVVVQAPGPDLSSIQQMFDLFQQMQRSAAPQQQNVPPPPPPQMTLPSPPPPGSDANAQIAWMRQAFDLFQRIQPPPVPAPAPQQAAPPPAASPPQAPAHQEMPPVQPPPGMIYVPGFGYVPVSRLMQAIGGAPQEEPRRAPPYRPRPSGYAPGGYRPNGESPDYQQDYSPPRGGPRGYGGGYPDPREYRGGYPQQQGTPQPPPPPRTPADEFRDAVSVVRTAVQSLREVESILPGGRRGAMAEVAQPQQQAEEEDDPSPVRIVEAGPAKLLFDAEGREMRPVETFLANLPSMIKWGGEQIEQVRKAQAERQQTEQRRVLPPGYVEVTKDYRPPPGYTAVPIDQEDDLPHPPKYMPPPIQSNTPDAQPWGAPPSWRDEDGKE